jgi:hypothetical protein
MSEPIEVGTQEVIKFPMILIGIPATTGVVLYFFAAMVAAQNVYTSGQPGMTAIYAVLASIAASAMAIAIAVCAVVSAIYRHPKSEG